MHPERLFLERCTQATTLLESHKEIDLLDLAAKLRQILLDSVPLVHKANKRKIKLRFKVGTRRSLPDAFDAFVALEDGLDPDTRPPDSPSVDVDFDNFLNHKIVWIKGSAHSVADIIKFAANVAGGVHHTDNPKEAQKALTEISAFFRIGGLPAGMRQLKAIGRVTLKGLQPLIETVKRDSSS